MTKVDKGENEALKDPRAIIQRTWRRRTAQQQRLIKVAAVGLAVLFGLALVVASYASLFQTSKPATTSKKNQHHTTASSKTSKGAGSQPNPPPTPPIAPAPSATSGTVYPNSILALTNWKLTLPIAAAGSNDPQEITQPQLANFALAPYFQLNTTQNGVQFQAPVGGVTTKNSNFPRSELREMTNAGRDEASWSDTSGVHVMTIRQAITHLPAVRPELVAGQIHDASDYIILIRLEGAHLFVEGDGKNVGTLDAGYQLGTPFTLQVIASDGHIRVLYNGVQKVDYAKSGAGYYFKAGCYTQSNPTKGDNPSDYGQVVIYDLQVTHSG